MGIKVPNAILKIWKEFIQTAHECDWVAPENIAEGDLAHLKALNAAPELIEAAKFQAGLDEFTLAPAKDVREHSADFFFKNSLPIWGMDGDYLLWMDCRDINSPILYVAHDGPEVFVAANNFHELIEGLIKGYRSLTFKELEESAFGNYLETFENNPKATESIPIIETSTTIRANFNHAKLGAGIDHIFFKENYEPVETPTEVGILTFEKIADEIIAKRKRDNFIFYAVTFFLFISLTAYVHFTCDPTCPECNPNCGKECGSWLKSILKGTFYTFCTLFVIGSAFTLIADWWYSWRDKRKAKA